MTVLPNGVYHISKWGSHDQPQLLTLYEGQVTVLPSGEGLKGAQEVRHYFLMRKWFLSYQ